MSYSKIFERCFPYYLSIGMTVSEYWDGDNTIPKAFREAEKARVKRMNFEAWLHGRYVYDALAKVSPFFRDFNRSGTAVKPYNEKPYPIGEQEVEKQEEEEQKREVARGKDYMEHFMKQWNQRFEEKEVKHDGSDSRFVGSSDNG